MATPQELQTLIDVVNSLHQKELECLLQTFQFKNMINISILDFRSIRLHLNFVKKLGAMDLFYNDVRIVKYCWEFVLRNLLCLEKLPVDDILFNLLELLKCLISKMKTLNKYTLHLQNEKERVFDVLASITKFQIFAKLHVPNCTCILNELIEIDGCLPPSALENLANIARAFKKLQVVYEMIVLCDISFRKFTFATDLCNVCATWLLENVTDLLKENNESDTLVLLLKVVAELYTKNSYFTNIEKEQFKLNLKKMSRHLIFLSGKQVLREESLKLLAIVIHEYLSREIDIEEDYMSIFNKIFELPADIMQWPQAQSKTFFYICSYLCAHSSLPWGSLEVIDSISRFIYSYERFTIRWDLLKLLCYIYPCVTTNNIDKATLLLGEDLLIILSRFPQSFSKIITYQEDQLVWLLRRGDRDIKKRVLIEWLKRDEDLNILKKAITLCRAGNILLNIVTDWRINEVCKKATKMCHKMEDAELSENIAYMIPRALHDKRLMYKLILSNPGIPVKSEMAIKLCEFMSLIMCFIDDESVLRAACVYSKALITALKKEKNVVSVFCKDLRNIEYLTIRIRHVTEETAVVILRLLKVLILVQKRNKIVMENRMEASFPLSLADPASKTEKYLDLLQVIVTSEEVFIQIEKSCILNIFICLCKTSQVPNFAVQSFICLTGILKTNEWLAQMHRTGIFVEIQCSLAVDRERGLEFPKFLEIWLKILKNSKNAFYLPDKRIISSYIRRADLVYQGKVAYLLSLLNEVNLFN